MTGSTAAVTVATIVAMADYCDCDCMGCRYFHGDDLAEGNDAHHTRLLLALDRSIAAACRSRGLDACDGLNDKAPCEVGTLHTRAAELALALAAAIDDPNGGSETERCDRRQRAREALEALLLELASVTGGRPRAS